MSNMVVVLAVAFALYLGAEVVLGIIRAISKPKAAKPVVAEQSSIVFRKHWVDVEPAPLKVIVFVEGKVECRLVMHGPYNGVITRLLMLWKGDKYRSITLDALCAVTPESVEQAYTASFEEARKIAQAVYGKKKHAKTAAIAEQAAPKPQAEAMPVPVVVVEQRAQVAQVPVVEEPAPLPRERVVAPIIKGFVAQYVGEIVSAGVHKHPTGNYDTFTLTLNTVNGPEHITGVDVKRAMDVASAGKGDKVRVIHLKDIDLPNGFKKKSFQIVKLANQPA